MDFFESTFLGNTLREWGIALLVALAVLALLRIFLAIIVGRIGALSRRTKTNWDDIAFHAIKQTKFLILVAAAVYAGSLYLDLSERADARLIKALVVVLWLQVGIWGSAALRGWLETYRAQRLSQDASAATVVTIGLFVGRLILWATISLLVLDNLGVHITALLAGLGVGGIAIALALQNILGDLFASLSIILDKPFVIGDFLVIGDLQGTVESIGLKTTRMRSLTGEELVFSNNDLLTSRIRNYGRLAERRIVFSIGVTNQTPRDKLERIPQIMREAVETQEKTRFDRSHLKEFGNFSINFETVYYVVVPDYNTYMDIQQAINLRIHQRLEEEGIAFAYPTQTVYLAKEPD